MTTLEWPDGPLDELTDWLNGFIDADTMIDKITARFNLLVARVGQVGPTTTGIQPTNPDGSTTGSGRTSISTQFLFRSGPFVFLYCNFTTGSANISVTNVGNLLNTPVAVIDPAYRSSLSFQQGIPCGPSGRMASFTIDAGGVLRLVNTTPGADIPGGTNLSASGSFLVG